MIKDEDKPKFRMVKYHQHGLLTREINYKTDQEFWRFKTSDLTCDHEGEDLDLITVLNNLSEDGYELVTGHDGEYILRTKDEIEYEQEYYEHKYGSIIASRS